MNASLQDRLTRLNNAQNSRPAHRISCLQENDTLPPISRRTFALDEHPGLATLPGAAVDAARILLRNETNFLPPIKEWIFLDTETSGLAGGAGTYVFLTGVGQFVVDDNADKFGSRFDIDLYFLDDLGSEPKLLDALAQRLRDAPVVVTYNGKLFDLPLLETRFRLNRMEFPLSDAIHLDLLFPARLLWRLRFGSARLIALEQGVLGFHRKGDIPGEDIPGRYFDYLRTGRAEPLLPVAGHNAWDIASLAALTGTMLAAVADTKSASHDSLDLFGLSRIFEKAGRTNKAQLLYERALDGQLPLELERVARRNLALLYKRERAHARAAAQWRELAATQADSLSAYEELAICYEHRLHELTAALSTSQDALELVRKLRSNPVAANAKLLDWEARFSKRLRRLEEKLGRKGNRPSRTRCASLLPDSAG